MKRKELTIKKEISFNLNLHSKELYVHSRRKKNPINGFSQNEEK